MELYGRAGIDSRSDSASQLFGNELLPHEPNGGPEPGAAEQHRLQSGVEAVPELGAYSNFYERREHELRGVAIGAQPAIPWRIELVELRLQPLVIHVPFVRGVAIGA